MTEKQKENVARIVGIAERYVARNQRQAVKEGRIEDSILTANRWANTLAQFKEEGIEPLEHVFLRPPDVIYL